MPVYEFRCAECDERFEIVCGLAELDEKAVCPACASRDVARVYGSFAVGISRTRLNPGVFERSRGKPPAYKPPADPAH